ncbi:hypothetical protein L9F63_015123, partial [Diploptera punctata]
PTTSCTVFAMVFHNFIIINFTTRSIATGYKTTLKFNIRSVWQEFRQSELWLKMNMTIYTCFHHSIGTSGEKTLVQ